MKKAFLYAALIFVFFLVSCSNAQINVLTSQEDTLRSALNDKSNKTIWTKEIEADRLSVKLNSNISVINKDIVSPQMLGSIKDLQGPVYPEIKNFANLDCTSMNKTLLSTMDDFCKQISKSTDNLESFFVSEYFFNYVFFKTDFEEILSNFKKGDENFDHYVICKAFESQDLTQVPVRLYNRNNFVDLSVYLTYHNGYKITEIEVIRWGKIYGESDKANSKK